MNPYTIERLDRYQSILVHCQPEFTSEDNIRMLQDSQTFLEEDLASFHIIVDVSEVMLPLDFLTALSYQLSRELYLSDHSTINRAILVTGYPKLAFLAGRLKATAFSRIRVELYPTIEAALDTFNIDDTAVPIPAKLDPPVTEILNYEQGNLTPHPDMQVNSIGDQYYPLPEEVHETDTLDDHTPRWKLGIYCSKTDIPPLNIEVRGDVYLGRAGIGCNPDLDLSPFGALQEGVSRQHAMLRPTSDQLLLIDLGSTNGTYVNEVRIPTGRSVRLNHRDTVAFGRLGFTIMIRDSVE